MESSSINDSIYSNPLEASIVRLISTLNEPEKDQLKLKFSQAAAVELEDRYLISADVIKEKRFFQALRYLLLIHPVSKNLNPYGIAYIGRPSFMTDAILEKLKDEAILYRQHAWPNFNQYMFQVPNNDLKSVAKQIAESKELYELVQEKAGPCFRTYISTYIYYDEEGSASKPHVDNAFTSITVMIGLRHDCENQIFSSKSVSYWPEKKRFDYQLKPGEISIFFGECALHARTPVKKGEIVHSLLISFKILT